MLLDDGVGQGDTKRCRPDKRTLVLWLSLFALVVSRAGVQHRSVLTLHTDHSPFLSRSDELAAHLSGIT